MSPNRPICCLRTVLACRPIVGRPKNNSPKRLSPNWFFARPSELLPKLDAFRLLHGPLQRPFKFCFVKICLFASICSVKMDFTQFSVHPFEAAYACLLTIVFLILAFVCQRKTWLWMGMTTTSAFGVAYLVFPGYLLKLQVGSTSLQGHRGVI